MEVFKICKRANASINATTTNILLCQRWPRGGVKKKDVDRGVDGVYFSQVPSGQNKCSKFEFGLVAHGTHSSSLCQLPLKVKEKPAQGPPAFSPEKH